VIGVVCGSSVSGARSYTIMRVFSIHIPSAIGNMSMSMCHSVLHSMWWRH
jgi:hypothetical protein